MQDFTLNDEGEYWETGDEKLLQDAFKRYTVLIESFASSLETYPKKSGESFEAYFERLLQKIHEKFIRKSVTCVRRLFRREIFSPAIRYETAGGAA